MGVHFFEKLAEITVWFWNYFSKLSIIPLVSFPINFFVSATSAYLSVSFLSHGSFLNYVTFLNELEKQTISLYKKYVVKYSLATGFFSAILIYSQFQGGVKLLTSTAYGLAGPYVLLNKMLKSLSFESLNMTNKVVKEKLSSADKEINKDTEIEMEIKKALNGVNKTNTERDVNKKGNNT